jgi:hypothetical protein
MINHCSGQNRGYAGRTAARPLPQRPARRARGALRPLAGRAGLARPVRGPGGMAGSAARAAKTIICGDNRTVAIAPSLLESYHAGTDTPPPMVLDLGRAQSAGFTGSEAMHSALLGSWALTKRARICSADQKSKRSSTGGGCVCMYSFVVVQVKFRALFVMVQMKFHASFVVVQMEFHAFFCPAAETAVGLPTGSARVAHADEGAWSRPRLDSSMGGSTSSRCSTWAAPRHARPAGREPRLYLVSAPLRAVAAPLVQ